MNLAEISRLDDQLTRRFRNRLHVDPSLARSLVSFQANKREPFYRWYKFKEAFSATLVRYFLEGEGPIYRNVLDPFAGSGTTLFAASDLGVDADGIELLPVGIHLVRARMAVLDSKEAAAELSSRWMKSKPWLKHKADGKLSVLRITQGAYPKETQDAISRYLGAVESEAQPGRDILIFALLCILESVSYTRKDGQYLRWDQRSGRGAGKNEFCKGKVLDFEEAITKKLADIITDLRRPENQTTIPPNIQQIGKVRILNGSSLTVLPSLPQNSYDAIFTSPPYCNRYDYTRTYALELAALGYSEGQVTGLRQEMLSCTVENREKDLAGMNPGWRTATEAASSLELLTAINEYLRQERESGRLNNNGIPRMVAGYFQEMACIIGECARVLKPGGTMYMVNDNVRYAGAAISVDLILSSVAEKLGFATKRIIVLPTLKGNSSQQMGRHGRDGLRKCIYVWRKQ